MNLSTSGISFRQLTENDLPTMHRWVNTPYVREWWDRLPALEDVAKKYGPRIAGKEPTRAFIIEFGERPIGYIQTYRIADYPDYARHLGTGNDAAGVDLFVGEPDAVPHRFGSVALREFLRVVVFADDSVTECVIGPETGNRRSIRSYEKAGFRYWKSVEIPGERAPEYLMRMTRAEFAAGAKIPAR